MTPAEGDPVTIVLRPSLNRPRQPITTAAGTVGRTGFLGATMHVHVGHETFVRSITGSVWICGHHAPDSKEAQALLAAFLLTRE